MLKERLPKEVRLNGTCSSGADDDRNDRVLLRVVMCRLRYSGTVSTNLTQNSLSTIFCIVFSVLFCALAVLNPRVGHTMDVLSPFSSIATLFKTDGQSKMQQIRALQMSMRAFEMILLYCIVLHGKTTPCPKKRPPFIF